MPTFAWEAKTRIGEVKKGEMKAANSDAVRQKLTAQNLIVDKVKKKSVPLVITMPGASGVTTREMVVFTRQFATMIDAGLPLVQCLEILGGQSPNPIFKNVILDIKTNIESGQTLAEALKRHPKIFNTLFVNLVAAGEAGGVLDTILNRLANYIEKNMKLAKQVRGAMVYPIIVISVSIVVTLVLLLFVIPIFEKMFAEMGSQLPALTQMVVNLSNGTRDNVGFLILGIVGIGTGLVTLLKSKRGRRWFDELTLTMPIIGPTIKKVAVAKFTRTMGTMLSSGVNILDALEIVAGTAGNLVIEEGLRVVRARISEGQTLAQPLSELSVFPPMVVQMISVGEATGNVDAMLNKIADFYDDEVDSAIGTMMAMLEPVIMAFLAVILGGLVIAMYLPVFSIAGGASAG